MGIHESWSRVRESRKQSESRESRESGEEKEDYHKQFACVELTS